MRLQVTECVINPAALSQAELYGAAHPATGQWHDGVLAHVMRSACRDKSTDQMWVVLDGPVDACWVESINTLLDKSRVLSLLSGERLALPPRVGPCPAHPAKPAQKRAEPSDMHAAGVHPL